jgi:RNA polymerase-binding transcription factor DksA
VGAQLQKAKKILEGERPGATRMTLRQPQNTVVENGADVLEAIWRSADCEVATASFGTCSGLFRNIRDALVGIKEEAFGVCLCCRTMIGLRRRRAAPWTPLCIRCQDAADRDDAEVLRSR